MHSQLSFLFDLDGTLLNTDHLHLQAYNILLKDYDLSINSEYYNEHVMGSPNDKIMRRLLPDIPQQQHSALSDRKEELFRAALTGTLAPTPGLLTLLDWAEANAVTCCVVTNAPRLNAEQMLASLGLDERLPNLVIGEELDHGKPHPLPYLEGLRRTGGAADRALAFEDSAPGVKSASSAGIFTFGMLGALDETTLRRAGASRCIADFVSAELWDVLARLIKSPALSTAMISQ